MGPDRVIALFMMGLAMQPAFCFKIHQGSDMTGQMNALSESHIVDQVLSTTDTNSDLVCEVPSSCKDSSNRRRSGMTCAELAGIDDNGSGNKFVQVDGPPIFANFCGGKALDEYRLNKKKSISLEKCEGMTHCCETCQTAPLNILAGGDSHGTGQSQLRRPEWIRSARCMPTECDACTVPEEDSTGCFHGLKSDGHALFIEVDANSPYTNYSASLLAKCPPGADQTWAIYPQTCFNGKLSIFADWTLVRALDFTSPRLRGRRWRGKGATRLN